MSLFSAFFSSTTGLQAAAQDLSVIGDNIANANTVGFKGSRADFEDALTQSVIGGSGEIGLGARLQAVQKLLVQGAINSTGIATDLALQGNGYFVVNGNHNGQTANFYTRAGNFTVDQSGYLVNLDGLRVQGFQADAAGNLSGLPTDLLVGTATALPQASTTATIKANLQADAQVITGGFDPNNPSNTSNFSTSVTLYDSLGTAHQTQVFFTKTASGWDWNAMSDAKLLDATAYPASTNGLQVIANGTLAFNPNGTFLSNTPGSAAFVPAGLGAQPVTFDLGGITQFAAPSASTFIGQDGFSSGQLTSIQVNSQGDISGVFTNGQTRLLGRVAVAGFPAPDQLQSVGANLYAQSQASGQPVVGAPGDGGRATLISGSLEQSSVDLAEQFVHLIAAQRAFEANSKTITTADQLLSELIQLKR